MAGFFGMFGGKESQPTSSDPNNQQQVNSPPPPPAPSPTPAPAPLDSFSKLWEPNPTPKEPDPTKPGSIFASANLDEMYKAAKGVNFTQHIDPSLVARVTKGGDDAAQALLAIINDVGQRAYAQAAFVSTQVTDRGIEKFSQGLDSRLPGVIKKQSVSESVASSNPAFKHPALAPVIAAVAQQFQTKFPHASAEEINDYTLDYLQNAGKLIVGGKDDPVNAQSKGSATSGSANDDWSGFFNQSGS